ncbi:MAG: aminotransferase class III-fold pyridoxal phosphate-dependent enzyme, partial [Acidobacteria bacterium]|nr:aminotransferase class III-fold pyridoxal phosphate-dependent enzyme [Acidobacteriota bacterium]
VLLDALMKVKEKRRSVGDVRGRGLLIGIDLVRDRQTKEPWPKAWCEAFFQEAMGRGLILMGYSPRVRIHPPLILSEAEALEGAAVIDEALGAVEAQVI